MQLLAAVFPNMHWNRIAQFNRGGIGAFRVGKDVQIGYVERMQEIHRFLEVLIAFPRETYDYVNANATVRIDTFDMFYAVLKQGSVVFSAHQL